MSETKEMLV